MNILWQKPNKNKIETNDKPETVKYCESLGWKKIKESKKNGNRR